MSNLDPRQCWRTPPDLWERMNAIWSFDVDAAADQESHLCDRWFGPDNEWPGRQDGLKNTWPDNSRVYCNPGFSAMGDWLKKAYLENRSGNIELAVVMAHVQTSAAWWSTWALWSDEIIFLTPRVQFVPLNGIKRTSNSRDNCLIIYRRGPELINAGPRISTWRWK